MNKNRPNEILELLTKERRMEVSVLAERIGVSQVTIRKDLDALEARGILKREHGAAILAGIDDVGARMAWHYEEKQKIARRAAEMIHDGDTVMIESGSTCILFAEVLAQTKKDLTIVTNSALLAARVGSLCHFPVMVLGGIYQPEAQVMVGPMVREAAKGFYVKHLFIGIDSYSAKTGFTNLNQLRAQAVRDMAKQAESVVVLTESAKFERRGIVPLGITEKIRRVITDPGIKEAQINELLVQGIEVILAE